MAVFVSQVAVETLLLPTSANVLVSQVVVEVLETSTPTFIDTAVYQAIDRGPPIPGSPWFKGFVEEDAYPKASPPQPDPDPPVYAPEIHTGPGMGPWNPMQRPEEDSYLLGDPEPPPVGPEVQLPEIGYGPPILGAPWLARIPAQEFAWAYEEAVLPGTPGGGTTPTSSMLFVPRVPSAKDQRRFNRFTEQVSDIINALIRNGQLTLDGINDWSIENGDTDGGTW